MSLLFTNTLKTCIGTHQCSAPELLEGVVLDWREEELRLFVPEDNRGVGVKEESQIVKFNRS